MKKSYFKKLTCLFITMLLFFSSVPASAETKEKFFPFDEVHVQKDLESIDGFSYLQYPYDPTGFYSPQIFNVVEFAYSYRANMQNDYALYIYFYNPQALDIDAMSNQNKIVMAVDYDKYPVTQDSSPTSYETFDLAFCSRSTGDYENLFYKFRIVDHESADGKTVLERVNSVGRRYDISEVLIKTAGEDNATAYGVGGSYYFTGYAAGYGSDVNAESTLQCDVLDLETVELKVNSTFFRTQSSSLGAGHQNQLNTVYFGVPNELLEKYGKLQKVKAEWYEYKTKPIYITTDSEAYAAFKQHIGESVGSVYNQAIGFGMGFGYKQTGTDVTIFSYDNAFNVYKNSGALSNEVIYNYIDAIYYIFHSNTISAGETIVTTEELEQYIKDYGPGTNQLPIKDGTISADLFENHVDAERNIGFNVIEIDANDKFDMLSYDDTHSFWDKLFDYGIFSQNTTDDTYKSVAPIYAVTTADLQKTDIFYDPLVAVIPNKLFEKQKLWSLTQLMNSGLPFIRSPSNSGSGASISKFLEQNHLNIPNQYEIDTNTLQLKMVATNRGWTITYATACCNQDIFTKSLHFQCISRLGRKITIAAKNSVSPSLISLMSRECCNILKNQTIPKILSAMPSCKGNIAILDL